METRRDPADPAQPPDSLSESSVSDQIKHLLIGKPRDLRDRKIFHTLTLVPFLAWVGMGADGLSSSAYGPAEAFVTLGKHTYLAAALAVLMAFTVFVISAGYSRIIEAFPFGGGGYVVATKLLGSKVGVVSGCALLVDYMLTITVSLAAAGDALFSFLPPAWIDFKLPMEYAAIALLIVLNLRGVRESVLALTPIFILFLVTHAALLVLAIGEHVADLPRVAGSLSEGFQSGWGTLGAGGMLLLLLHAYSLGGGTYTGIEAVSNGLPILREPKVFTGKRTMLYMAISLAVTACGLLLSYLLVGVSPHQDKTLNAVLLESVAATLPLGGIFVVVTLLAEGALLFVAAQTGFVDGPRVLANMAVDSWMPRRFAALSERLTTQNGILLMGVASLGALWHTQGNVHDLVIMYSINVFLTFSLSMLGMLRHAIQSPKGALKRGRDLTLFSVGFILCGTILVVTVLEKFREGGWLTLLVTGSLVAVCFLIKRHYQGVSRHLSELDRILDQVPDRGATVPATIDPNKPTAAVLVGAYGGLGIHTVLNIFRAFPRHYENLAFLSVGVIDSGQFKGEQEMEALKASTQKQLDKYVELARRLGKPAISRWAMGTDAVDEAEKLCLSLYSEFPKTTFFAGQVVFQLEQWYHRWLHNQTAFIVQKRLQMDGITMVILPVRIWEPGKRPAPKSDAP